MPTANSQFWSALSTVNLTATTGGANIVVAQCDNDYAAIIYVDGDVAPLAWCSGTRRAENLTKAEKCS
jgi:hypothetical protein